MNEYKPTWRKPFGMGLILAIIAVWAIIVASFSGVISTWPRALQLAIYVTAGTVWIFPMKPLLRWMETGRWK